MSYKTLVMAILAVFLPIKSVILVVLTIVGVDLVLGVCAAKRRNEPLTSSGFKRTIMKLAVYESVVLLAFLVEQYLTGDFVPIVKILSGYIGITELKSCMENMEDITGVPILKALIDKLSKAGQ
jgi:ABC-type sugar transport system permease subunit